MCFFCYLCFCQNSECLSSKENGETEPCCRAKDLAVIDKLSLNEKTPLLRVTQLDSHPHRAANTTFASQLTEAISKKVRNFVHRQSFDAFTITFGWTLLYCLIARTGGKTRKNLLLRTCLFWVWIKLWSRNWWLRVVEIPPAQKRSNRQEPIALQSSY